MCRQTIIFSYLSLEFHLEHPRNDSTYRDHKECADNRHVDRFDSLRNRGKLRLNALANIIHGKGRKLTLRLPLPSWSVPKKSAITHRAMHSSQ